MSKILFIMLFESEIDFGIKIDKVNPILSSLSSIDAGLYFPKN
ncbi:MAG: hypothetical protein ACRD6U_01775 [Nitrososphaeraceae archaeon]